MTRNLADEFLRSLPAGEWVDVRLQEKSGLMAESNWAVLATANCVRRGGRRLFLKCIFPASESAGPTSVLMTAAPRLSRLENRLRRLQQVQARLPIVPILEVQRLPGIDALLIAMEPATPLDSLIDGGTAGPELAIKLLRSLHVSESVDWHHFDVCPSNLGICDNGDVVLLDVDSLFLDDHGRFAVSLAIWKPFRSPPKVKNAVAEDMERLAMHLERATAVRKYSFEVALAAAECSIGRLPQFDQATIADWLASWARRRDFKPPFLVDFWQERLRAAIAGDSAVDLNAIADALEKAMRASGFEVTASAPQVSTPAEPERCATKTADVPTAPVSTLATPWINEWESLRPSAESLRRDRLTTAALLEYRKKLLDAAARFPLERQVWLELLLVAISYERDPRQASEIADQAVKNLPGDKELRRWKRIVQMWQTN